MSRHVYAPLSEGSGLKINAPCVTFLVLISKKVMSLSQSLK